MLLIPFCVVLSGSMTQCEKPDASSALQWFLHALPVMLEDKVQGYRVLLGLITPQSHENLLVEESSNLLFAEEPINNYKEELSLVQDVCSSLQQLLSAHSQELQSQLLQLSEIVLSQVRSCLSVDCFCYSAWEKPNFFMYVCKVMFLAKLLLTARPQMTVLRDSIDAFVEVNTASLHPLIHKLL